MEKVKNVIYLRHTRYEYAIPIYNMANLDQINEDNINFSISDQLFFDTLLNNKIVAAFRGMHVSPAKHSFGKCDRKV